MVSTRNPRVSKTTPNNSIHQALLSRDGDGEIISAQDWLAISGMTQPLAQKWERSDLEESLVQTIVSYPLVEHGARRSSDDEVRILSDGGAHTLLVERLAAAQEQHDLPSGDEEATSASPGGDARIRHHSFVSEARDRS